METHLVKTNLFVNLFASFQANRSLQYSALKLKKVDIFVEVVYMIHCLSFFVWVSFYVLQFTHVTDADVFTKPSNDPSKSNPFTNMCLSRSVFHWRKPQVLKAIADWIVVWDIDEDLVETQCPSFDKVKIIRIQKEPITVLTTTDGYPEPWLFIVFDIHLYLKLTL